MNKDNFVNLQSMATIANNEYLESKPVNKTQLGLHINMRQEGTDADGVSIDEPQADKRIMFLIYDNSPNQISYTMLDATSQSPTKTININNCSVTTIKNLISDYFK
tara:strand:+ start:288 stop:605 length:318 start_codon:yes stop_codon:yes gene_type:complete